MRAHSHRAALPAPRVGRNLHRSILAAVLALSLLLAPIAQAATLTLSPSSGTYTVGERISVRVRATTDQPMNAVSSSLTFDTGALSLEGISKTGSFLGFWVVDPKFSNSAGTAEMEGVTVGTGATGAQTVATLTFRAKAPGTASVRFGSGSVLAHDGSGTELLAGTAGATFTIVPKKDEPAPPAEEPDEEPSGDEDGAPKITSTTHPVEADWYALDKGTFAWQLPGDAGAIRTILSKNRTAAPSVLYDGIVKELTLDDLPEGLSYLRLQIRTGDGWGPAGTREIRVDTVAPSVSATESPRNDPTDPVATLSLSATDATSGIESFRIIVDGHLALVLPAGAGSFRSIPLAPGTRTLTVEAVDRAGNVGRAEVSVVVEGLTAPVITKGTIEQDGQVYPAILGTSEYPDSLATIYFGDSVDTSLHASGYTAKDGSFAIRLPKELKVGSYEVRAVITDARGARSLPSEKLALDIGFPFFDLGQTALVYLAFALAILVLIGAMVLLLIFLFGRVRREQEDALMREIAEARDLLGKSFKLLSGDAKSMAESKTLMAKDKASAAQLRKDLKEAEELLGKEVADIEVAAKKERKKRTAKRKAAPTDEEV